MLSEFAGRGWIMAEPPLESDEESVIARVDGEPLRAGFLIDRFEDSEEVFHSMYRSGQYDVEIKIDFDIGRGQARIREADGYNLE